MVAVFAGAAAQTVTGIGLVLICGPVLVLTVGPADAVRLALIISLILNAALLIQQPRAIQVRQAGRLVLPAAAVSIPLGIVLRGSSAQVVAAVAGGVILASTALMWRGSRWAWLSTRGGTVAAGAASGAMNVASGAAGPFAALYAVNAGWPASARTMTLQAYFAVLNIIALLTLGLPHRTHMLGAAATGLVTGLLTGRMLTPRLSQLVVRRLVLFLSAAGGTAVLVQALT
jgi:uncharacterized membrane protein YfcA